MSLKKLLEDKGYFRGWYIDCLLKEIEGRKEEKELLLAAAHFIDKEASLGGAVVAFLGAASSLDREIREKFKEKMNNEFREEREKQLVTLALLVQRSFEEKVLWKLMRKPVPRLDVIMASIKKIADAHIA